MSWVVEHLHRDGSVLARATLADSAASGQAVSTGQELRMGRALDNDLVLDDPHCAAHHAALRVDADGRAQLHDLNTVNGIHVGTARHKGKRLAMVDVVDDGKIQLGASTIRIRHSSWPLAPELPFSRRMVWPWALFALSAALAYTGWDMWLGAVYESSPPYLSGLSGMAAGLALWSAMYSLLGRVLGGPDRFFTHLFIVSCAYLGISLLGHTLNLLAFSFYWLWPMRIEGYLTVVAVGLTVRAHLRVADPHHWPTLRWGVALACALAIVVPLGQNWITSKRLTHVQSINLVLHPALRVATPVSMDEFLQSTQALQQRVDKQRALDNHGDSLGDSGDGDGNED